MAAELVFDIDADDLLEARLRPVWRTRTDTDGRQPDADAVEKAAPRVVGQEQLANRFLSAVARERRGRVVVADHVGERSAEHCDRRGEDDSRAVPLVGRAD